MNAQVVAFLALVLFQLLGGVTFLVVYTRESGWRRTAVGRHLVYWVAASVALDLSWALIIVAKWPWLIYLLYGAQGAVGLLNWYRIVLVVKARRGADR